MAPFLFQELFLVYFTEVLAWYGEQRSRILSSLQSGGSDEAMVSTLSRMSGGQASALKELERDYEVLLDENCTAFVQYFKQLLRLQQGDDGDGDDRAISPPTVVLFHKNQTFCNGDEDHHVKTQGFESPNRRYNVMLYFL